jgi:hypothetical protein
MHGLEQEFAELRDAGVLHQDAATQAIARERGEVLSVFMELRIARIQHRDAPCSETLNRLLTGC